MLLAMTWAITVELLITIPMLMWVKAFQHFPMIIWLALDWKIISLSAPILRTLTAVPMKESSLLVILPK